MMKKYTNIYAMVAVLMLFIAGCSTEKVEAPIDDTNSQFTTITFGALLNDLGNRSMEKGHFAQVPTCADAEPAVAVIEFSYGGVEYSTTVDILSDGSGYFTDYSEDFKVPVSSSGSTIVTVTSFMVYDGDTSVASDAFYSPINGNLIWIAPKGDDAQFDGYVDNALPVQFEVFPGTKPYFDIEVLCFDRRVVNEYGYVFFDIVPKTIFPLCLFVNYCNEDGRHWVADYSIDLYFGTDDTGIQLYSNSNANAMATTGVNGGEFFADPLCLVIPGPPANLGNDDPYLYLVIYPQDWTNSYGDIDNTPVPVQLSRNMVNELLNDDGTTNEYLHLLVGECEDALDGDGTIPGGGGNECDPADPQADCDNDGILNGVDNCPELSNPNQEPDANCDGVPDTCDPNDAQADCDNDGILNGVDNCPTVANSNQGDLDGDGIGDVCDSDRDGDGVKNDQDDCPNVIPGDEQEDLDGDGCFTDPETGEECVNETPCDIPDVDFPCVSQFLGGADTFVESDTEIIDAQLIGANNIVTGLIDATFVNGELVVTISPTETFALSGYVIEVRPLDTITNEMSTVCKEFRCDASAGNSASETFENIGAGDTFFIRVKAIICPPVLP